MTVKEWLSPPLSRVQQQQSLDEIQFHSLVSSSGSLYFETSSHKRMYCSRNLCCTKVNHSKCNSTITHRSISKYPIFCIVVEATKEGSSETSHEKALCLADEVAIHNLFLPEIGKSKSWRRPETDYVVDCVQGCSVGALDAPPERRRPPLCFW